jgi:hypothetical protein
VHAKPGVERPGDVAGGVDVRERGPPRLVGRDTAHVEAAALEPASGGADADADDDGVAADALAGRELQLLDPPVAGRADDLAR